MWSPYHLYGNRFKTDKEVGLYVNVLEDLPNSQQAFSLGNPGRMYERGNSLELYQQLGYGVDFIAIFPNANNSFKRRKIQSWKLSSSSVFTVQ